MKIKLIVFLILCCGVLYGGSELPRFTPLPLVVTMNVPISETSNSVNFENQSYLIFGESYLNDPLVVRSNADASEHKSYLDKVDFYYFLSDLVHRYQTLDKPEDVTRFTYADNSVEYSRMLEQNWEMLRPMYNSLDHFRIRLAWFFSPLEVAALFDIVQMDQEPYTVSMIFTLADGEWKVKSGFTLDDEFLQGIEKSLSLISAGGAVEVFSVNDFRTTPLAELVAGEVYFAPTPILGILKSSVKEFIN